MCTEEKKRKLEELNVIDDFLMNAAASDAELPYDPFGEDYMMYQFYNQCEEVPGLAYGDGLRYIYFNTKGKKGGSPSIQEMLQYFQESTEMNAKGENLQRIHDHVKKVKILPEVREEFMRLDDIIYYEREEAAKEASEKADRNRAVQDILELLKEYGEPSENLRSRLEKETDNALLKKWLKLAAKSETLEDFEKKM